MAPCRLFMKAGSVIIFECVLEIYVLKGYMYVYIEFGYRRILVCIEVQSRQSTTRIVFLRFFFFFT